MNECRYRQTKGFGARRRAKQQTVHNQDVRTEVRRLVGYVGDVVVVAEDALKHGTQRVRAGWLAPPRASNATSKPILASGCC